MTQRIRVVLLLMPAQHSSSVALSLAALAAERTPTIALGMG